VKTASWSYHEHVGTVKEFLSVPFHCHCQAWHVRVTRTKGDIVSWFQVKVLTNNTESNVFASHIWRLENGTDADNARVQCVRQTGWQIWPSTCHISSLYTVLVFRASFSSFEQVRQEELSCSKENKVQINISQGLSYIVEAVSYNLPITIRSGSLSYYPIRTWREHSQELVIIASCHVMLLGNIADENRWARMLLGNTYYIGNGCSKGEFTLSKLSFRR